jgi:DNA-directed RNA polymerase specialized sigma24 family protein
MDGADQRFDDAPPADEESLRALVGLVASPENLEFLRRYLRSRHPSLAPPDAEDITTTVLTRLIERIRARRWVPEPDPAALRGYLRRAADWAVVDFHRLARRTRENPMPSEVLEDLVLSDDEAVAALSRVVTADGVRAALRRIRGSGDSTLFVVVTAMLDHIQRTGERPSNRQIAAACQLSHTAVAKALVRMRPYFAAARDAARDG